MGLASFNRSTSNLGVGNMDDTEVDDEILCERIGNGGSRWKP
jgi:hypothetical protein